MKFRKATKRDVSQMVEIIRLNNPKYSGNSSKEINEMFSTSLFKPTFIVAEENKRILAFNGYVSSWVDNNVYNLFWVNTHPNHIGNGIQTKLIKEIIKEIKKIKNPKAKIIMISTKIPSFFKKFGFKKIGQKYDRDYVLMAKGLR